MGEIIKWGILAAIIVVLIAMIVLLPFNDYINFGVVGTAFSTIITYVGNGFQFGRGLLNNFFSPFGRGALTGLLVYFFGKFFITIAIKIVSWVNHFIFKG